MSFAIPHGQRQAGSAQCIYSTVYRQSLSVLNLQSVLTVQLRICPGMACWTATTACICVAANLLLELWWNGKGYGWRLCPLRTVMATRIVMLLTAGRLRLCGVVLMDGWALKPPSFPLLLGQIRLCVRCTIAHPSTEIKVIKYRRSIPFGRHLCSCLGLYTLEIIKCGDFLTERQYCMFDIIETPVFYTYFFFLFYTT